MKNLNCHYYKCSITGCNPAGLLLRDDDCFYRLASLKCRKLTYNDIVKNARARTLLVRVGGRSNQKYVFYKHFILLSGLQTIRVFRYQGFKGTDIFTTFLNIVGFSIIKKLSHIACNIFNQCK